MAPITIYVYNSHNSSYVVFTTNNVLYRSYYTCLTRKSPLLYLTIPEQPGAACRSTPAVSDGPVGRDGRWHGKCMNQGDGDSMDRSCIHNVDKGPSIECTFDKDGRFPSQPPTYLPKGCDCDRPLRDHKFDCRTNYESRRRERKGLLLRSGELGDLKAL